MSTILAMPGLCDVTDFGLSNDAYNRKVAHSLLKKNPEIIFDLGDNVKVYKTGTNKGYIFLYNPEKDLIGYYVRYEEQQNSLVGRKVTQTKLWRSLGDEKAVGVTYKIVFDYLLKKYQAIMSDRLQTENGKDFWIRLMLYALDRGHEVVLADLNSRTIKKIDTTHELRLITNSPVNEGPWGYMIKHQAMRFAILAK
jgi:hypothetical protein